MQKQRGAMVGKTKGALLWLLPLAVISLVLIITRQLWEPLIQIIANLTDVQLETFKLRLDIILGIISLLSTLGTIAAFVYRRAASPTRSDALQKASLLTPITPQSLIDALPNPIGRKLFWVDRGKIQPDITTYRRIAIIAPPSFGKTREAAEILRRITRAVGENQAYRIANQLVNLPANTARQYLRSQLAENCQPILLFENLPPEQIPQLAACLPWSDNMQGYVLVTLSVENLSEKYRQWLVKHAYTLIELPAFNTRQIARMVEEIFARLGYNCSPEALHLLASTTLKHDPPEEMIRFATENFHGPTGIIIDRSDVIQVVQAVKQVRWQKSFQQFPLLKTTLVAIETLVDAGFPLDDILIRSFAEFLARKEVKRSEWALRWQSAQAMIYLRTNQYLRDEQGKLVYRNGTYRTEKKVDELDTFLDRSDPKKIRQVRIGSYVTAEDIKQGYLKLLERPSRAQQARGRSGLLTLLVARQHSDANGQDLSRAALIVSELLHPAPELKAVGEELDLVRFVSNLVLRAQYSKAAQAFSPILNRYSIDPTILLIASKLSALAGDVENELHYRLSAARRYQHYAAVLRQHHQMDDAALLLEIACSCDPQNAAAWGELGFADLVLDRHEKSAHAYQAALELLPRNPDFHFSLGLALSNLGRAEEAFQCFHQAVAIAPDLYQYRPPFWASLLFSRRFVEIIQDYRQYPAIIDQIPNTSFILGLALAMEAMREETQSLNRGVHSVNLDEAIAVFTTALARKQSQREEKEDDDMQVDDLQDDDMQYYLASFYRLNREPDKARVVLLDLISSRSSQAIYHTGLCHVCRQLGDPRAEEALIAARELIGAAPGFENAAFALLNGEKDRALGLLKGCLMDRGHAMEFSDFKRIWVRFDPDFILLQADPQFQKILDLAAPSMAQ